MNHTTQKLRMTRKKIISYAFLSILLTGSLFASERPLNFEIVPFDYQNADMKELICSMVAQDQEIQERINESGESIKRRLLKTGSKFDSIFFICRSLDEPSRIYGFVSCRNTAQIGYVDRIAVHKDYRCKGVAQSLLCQAESFSKNSGAKSLMLFMAHDNEKAMRSYCKYGFEFDEMSSSDVMTAMTKFID